MVNLATTEPCLWLPVLRSHALQTTGYAIANPSGKFLYATESDFAGTNQIEAFVIDSAGALTSINTYALDGSGYTTSSGSSTNRLQSSIHSNYLFAR